MAQLIHYHKDCINLKIFKMIQTISIEKLKAFLDATRATNTEKAIFILGLACATTDAKQRFLFEKNPNHRVFDPCHFLYLSDNQLSDKRIETMLPRLAEESENADYLALFRELYAPEQLEKVGRVKIASLLHFSRFLRIESRLSEWARYTLEN